MAKVDVPLIAPSACELLCALRKRRVPWSSAMPHHARRVGVVASHSSRYSARSRPFFRTVGVAPTAASFGEVFVVRPFPSVTRHLDYRR